MFFRAEKSDKGMKIISGECLEIKSIYDNYFKHFKSTPYYIKQFKILKSDIFV